VGIIAGVAVGRFFPNFGTSLKPLGDGFLKLIRMLVAPVVFFTVVTGIAKFGDLKRLGRVGLKSILYFESVTTLALVMGLVVATFAQPGRGINADPSSLDTSSIAQYTTGAAHTGTKDFLLNIIPDSFLGAFTRGEMLQVLLLAVLSGIALAMFGGEQKLVSLADSLSQFFFKMVALVMETHSPSDATAPVPFSLWGS
jgi:aerobic C4-dicarboxylate transport protein